MTEFTPINPHTALKVGYTPGSKEEQLLFDAAKAYAGIRTNKYYDPIARRRAFNNLKECAKALKAARTSDQPVASFKTLELALNEGYKTGLPLYAFDHGYIPLRPDVEGDNNDRRLRIIKKLLV